MESIGSKAGPRSSRAASSFPGAWRMLLLAGVSPRPRSSDSITCGLPASSDPQDRDGGRGLAKPSFCTQLVRELSCVYVCYSPLPCLCVIFPLLCLFGFVPLHPSGKAMPQILHELLKVCDPMLAQGCSKSMGAKAHPSPRPWKPALSSHSTWTAPGKGKRHHHGAWLLLSDPNKKWGEAQGSLHVPWQVMALPAR